MSDEDDIKWVTLTLDFPPELETALETRAKDWGLSVQCLCVHILYRELLRDAPAEQKERWIQNFPATLRRNGCDLDFSLPGSGTHHEATL